MDELTETRAFIDVIEQDVDTALEILSKDDTPYNRRAFIKNYYSFLEGLLYYMRQEVIKKAMSAPGTLSVAEMAVLKEETYYVSGKGKVQTQEKHLSFEQSFRISFHYFFKHVDSVRVDYGNGGWRALLEGLKIRNRITHPKQASQLTITEEELERVKIGKNWCDNQWRLLVQEHRTQMQRRSEDLQRQAAEMMEESKHVRAKTAEVRQVSLAIRNYNIKYPCVINAGLLGETSGVEVVLHRYRIYDGKKGIVVDPKEIVPSEVNFPVRITYDRNSQEENEL